MRVLTVKQPWADLIMAGFKPVENRTWPVPSTLPPWLSCPYCGARWRPGDDAGSHRAAQYDGPFPFTLGIHAAKQTAVNPGPLGAPWRLWNEANGWTGSSHPDELRAAQDTLPRGALLGTVQVTSCHHADHCATVDYSKPAREMPWEHHCSRWAEPDAWHWTLTNPQPLDVPVPMKGRQGLWTADLAAHVDQAVHP